MSENAKVDTLSKEEREVLRELARYRHELHTSWDDIFNSEATDILGDFLDFAEENNLPIDFDYEELVTDLDYYEILSDEEREEYEEQAEEYNRENPDSAFSVSGLQMWKEDGNYEEFAGQMENLNKQIEDYLLSVDEEHGTHYAPTGIARSRYSLELDSEGRELSEAQQEYFKDSEIRDEQGRLEVMYHGTARGDRVGYYFDPNRATSGPMAYFTNDKEIATRYSQDKNDTSLAYEDEDVNNYYLEDIVENAIIVERHTDEQYRTIYENGHRADRNIDKVDVLISAFEDGEYVVPVKLEVKEFNDGRKLVLYVAITDKQIKKDEVMRVKDQNDAKTPRSSSYSIAPILAKVKQNNPNGSLGKYIPKQFIDKSTNYSLDIPTTYALDDYDPFVGDDVWATKESKDAFANTIIKAANDVLDYSISDKSIGDIADKVIDEYSSTVDKDFVVSNLRNIFDAMHGDNMHFSISRLMLTLKK